MPKPTPSTISTGFTLSLPSLPNPATSDPAYTRVLQWYLGPTVFAALQPHLERFGAEAVSNRINDWVSNAEKQPPYVKSRNVWGERYPVERLVTSEGWKALGGWGVENGVIALGYESTYGPYRRIAQHALNYLYSASSGVFSCPVSMTSGAARLLAHQLPSLPKDHPFHEVYRRIVSRDSKENYISAQWMTERPGGSDVRNSETWATYSPLPQGELKDDKGKAFDEGDYLISGYKFFCSATDCDIALLLAKTQPSGQLSLFLAPTKRITRSPDSTLREESNGISFHRLKNKMGTRPLPTAELELHNLRAWLVGPLDRGIPTIATLLNVTRTHNFITALSCWRRGMAITKNFARERRTIDQPLWSFPMHLRLLAGMEVRFRGLLQMAFFTTSLLSFADNGFPPSSGDMQGGSYAPLPEAGEQTKIVQRALTATGKAVICKLSCIALQECQEGMGGVGYLDEPDEPEFNISRLYRDTAANMTWEGTTNVLASEVVRHMLNGGNLEVFGGWFEGKVVGGVRDAELKEKLSGSWRALKARFEEGKSDIGAALADGRQLMFSLAWVTCGGLLAHDAQRDGNPEALEVARRWVLDGEGGVGEYAFPDVVYAGGVAKRGRVRERERVEWDCRMVWGEDLPADAALGYRDEKSSGLRRDGRGQPSGRPEQVVAKL